MILNDESDLRLVFTVTASEDPTGSTVELKVDSSWHAGAWIDTPVASGEAPNRVWTQRARTTESFSGPAASPAGDVVLALGQHQCESRVTLTGGDKVVHYAGVVDVRTA